MDLVLEILAAFWKLWTQWPLRVLDFNLAAIVVFVFHSMLIFSIYGFAIQSMWFKAFLLMFALATSVCATVFFVPLAYYGTCLMVLAMGVFFWREINKDFKPEQG